MKKLLPLSLLVMLTLWVGCGDDESDGGGTGPIVEKPVRVIVATVADSLPFQSVNDAEWNNVETFAIEVKTSGIALPKPVSAEGLFTVDSVNVQVISTADYLYLRLKWNDSSHSVWKKYFAVDTIKIYPEFKEEPLLSADEDQMFVMFDGAPGGGWDTWNWRAVTTGAAGFGEGFTYYSVVSPADSLVPDASGSLNLDDMAIENKSFFGDPNYASFDTSDYNRDASNDRWILCFADARTRSQMVDTEFVIISVDPDTTDTIIITWPVTSGWTIGQRIPGWIIYCDEKNQPDGRHGSRWDIRTLMAHDQTTGDYTLVMKRKLHTTYPEDINFKLEDSVKTRIIVGNNSADLYNSSTTNRAISKDFWIIF